MATNINQETGATSIQQKQKMLVIDIGKRKRKQVRRLRKGEGRLAEEIEQTVDNLKNEGVLDTDAQTVVVVVRQKPKRNWMW